MDAAADQLIHGGSASVTGDGRAKHKIVFEYADSDDDEGTVNVVPRPADAEALTTDMADLEDPVEAAKLRGIDASDDGEASVDFVEDVSIPHEATAAALYAREVPLPSDLPPVPRAPDARVRTLRVQRGQSGAAARDAVAAVAEAPADAAAAEAADADEGAEEDPALLRKRERDTKVTADGYHLTTDERDLVEDVATGVTRYVQRPPRPEFMGALGEGGDAAPSAAAADDDDDVDEDGDDDEEEEEDEEDAMMDELLLVAAVEQTMRCCQDALVELRAEAESTPQPPADDVIDVQRAATVAHEIDAFTRLVEEGAAARQRLCDDQITPTEFALLVRPLMNRVNGALKRAARPPKPAPIVIDGKVMDM